MKPPPTPDEQEPTFGLVMPFVVVTSVGGPYDDTAFVAGCYYADIDRVLKDWGPPEYSAYVYPALVPQLDLLAMHHGYTMVSEPWEDHPDDWTLVTFSRPCPACDGSGWTEDKNWHPEFAGETRTQGNGFLRCPNHEEVA